MTTNQFGDATLSQARCALQFVKWVNSLMFFLSTERVGDHPMSNRPGRFFVHQALDVLLEWAEAHPTEHLNERGKVDLQNVIATIRKEVQEEEDRQGRVVW